MSCDDLQALNRICQVGQAITGGVAGAADSAFSHIAGYFGAAALSTTTWLWDQIDSATSLDLNSPELVQELAATAAIAAVLCLGLFLIQVITATLRREPGGLGRAVRGLFVSLLGSAFALASAKLLIAATDALSASVVSYTMGTNIHGGEKLAFAQLVSVANPALALIFAIVILCASVMVWAAMMTRKMMILIAAVLAPLAFSGATADITRSFRSASRSRPPTPPASTRARSAPSRRTPGPSSSTSPDLRRAETFVARFGMEPGIEGRSNVRYRERLTASVFVEQPAETGAGIGPRAGSTPREGRHKEGSIDGDGWPGRFSDQTSDQDAARRSGTRAVGGAANAGARLGRWDECDEE